MLGDKEATETYQEAYKQGISFWAEFLVEAEKDLKTTLGDQWEINDKKKVISQNRNALVFNKTKRILRLISGFQRKTRLALKISPIEGSDEKTAEQLTGVALHVMSHEHGYNTMSDAFENGSLKTGINLVNIYMDYLDDPLNGDIKLKRVPYNKFMLDPYFSERNLSDCNWLIRREYFGRMQCQALLPMVAPAIAKLPDRNRDDKFTYYQPPIDVTGKTLMSYDEFWKRDFRSAKMLVDRETGAVNEITGASRERLNLLTKAHPSLIVKKRYIPVMELYIIINGETMWKGEDPYGLGDFPYVPVMGFWEPEYNLSDWKLQGLARCIRDPQDETNKRRSKMLDIIDSQISSGWKAEEGAVVNPKALYQSGQGQVVWMTEDKYDRAQKLEIADIPAGLFRLMETLDKDIIEIPGGTEELLGQPNTDSKLQMSGVLGKLRQAAGLVGLQDMFDNYRYAKSEIGRKMVKLIQENYRPEKIKRIIGEEPTQEFYNVEFGKYDCTPQEGILSDNQRQMYYAELLGLKEMGAPIPWTAILEAAPIQHKSKLQEHIQQAEQAAAQDAQAEKLMERLSTALVQAETQASIAGTHEKISQALENRAGAALDRIKGLKELGSMDDKNMLELLKIIIQIEQLGQSPGEKQTKTAVNTKPQV